MGGRCDDSCDDGRGRRFNPADPRDLARELDNGNARTVMDALQRDAYTMQPRQFEQTVRQLAQIENPRYGDNLAVSRNGEIVINRADGQRFCIGNIYRQEEMADAYARRHDGDYRREIPRQPIVDPRYQPEPYYGGQDPRYRYPGTPPFFPEERHGRNGRVYDPYSDPRYGRGYGDNRQLGGQIVQDAIQGAIVGELSGGKAGRGAIANVGIGLLSNGLLFGNGRPRW